MKVHIKNTLQFRSMKKDSSKKRPGVGPGVILLSLIACGAGLAASGSASAYADGNTAPSCRSEQIMVAQAVIRPGQSYVIKPKRPSQEKLMDAAEQAHKRRLETAGQNVRYVVETTDGKRIDCKTITREKNILTLTTRTGTTLNIEKSAIKEITKFQYFNGRTKNTTMDIRTDFPEKAETTDE